MTPNDAMYYDKLPIRGHVVLDVGASMGDSALFFLCHGAKKVICIEAVKEWADEINLPNTQVINEPFKLAHLSIPHDVMKMDIEGAEAILLDYDRPLKPSVIEVHSQYLINRFEEHGFHRLHEPVNNMADVRICMMVNFS